MHRQPLSRGPRLAGALYLVTFASSIPAVLLLAPVLDGQGYVSGSADHDVRVTTGVLLDLVNAAACVGTAVALHPLVTRWAPARALGFVASRLFEAAVIAVGVVALLAVVVLRQQVADGALDPASASAIATALVAVRDWTFLLGPGLVPAVNAALLASALWQARALPRVVPLLGLVGAPLLLASALATLFGLTSQTSPLAAVAALPIFCWELSLGVWMLARGLRAPVRA